MSKQDILRERGGSKSSSYVALRLLSHVRPHLRILFSIQALALLLLGIKGVIPFAIRYLTEHVSQGDTEVLLWIPGVILVFSLLISVAGAVRSILSNYLAFNMGVDLQGRLFDAYLNTDLKDHQGTPAGERIATITFDINWIVQGAMLLYTNMVFMPVMVVGYTVILFTLDVGLASVAMVALPMVVGISAFSGKNLKRTSSEIQRQNAALTDYLSDTLGNIQVVKGFRREKWEMKRFLDILKEYLRHTIRDSIWNSAVGPATQFAHMLVFCILGWYAFYRISIVGDIEVSNFTAFIATLILFNGELKNMAQGLKTIARSGASYDRIDRVLKREPGKLSSGTREQELFSQGLKVESVDFAYNSKNVLHNVSLEISPKETIFLTGLSGAGKSTLLGLMVGLLEPTNGRVTLDGLPLEEISPESMRHLYSYVAQAGTLFNMTVRENIAYSLPGASNEKIEEAARAAGAHEFIVNLPEGYETHVGMMGERLSAGQRQRIAIARSLLVDAPIIVLDECFSNIDAITEQRIYQNISAFQPKRTLIVITHRLISSRNADRIFHLEDGRIIESGSHKELMELGGSYCRLFEISEYINIGTAEHT